MRASVAWYWRGETSGTGHDVRGSSQVLLGEAEVEGFQAQTPASHDRHIDMILWKVAVCRYLRNFAIDKLRER